MFRNRHLFFGGPQRETRVVSRETEITIPNRAAATIAVCVFGWAFIYFSSGHLFGPIVPAVMIGLSIVGLGFRVAWWWAQRIREVWGVRVSWKDARNVVVLILSLAISVTILAFYAMKLWYAHVPIWKELLVASALGFVGGTSPLLYFHFHNTINPNWPAPYWYAMPNEEEPPLLPFDSMGSIDAPGGL